MNLIYTLQNKLLSTVSKKIYFYEYIHVEIDMAHSKENIASRS